MLSGVLTLQALRVFCAVADEGSYSEAARRLGVTQPAVSAQMRSLTDHFGMALVERVGGGWHPTAAGERLLSRAHSVLADLDALEEELAGLRDRPAGPLHLVASTVPGEFVVPRLIGAFGERFPEIRLSVDVTDTGTAVAELLARRYDAALIGDEARDERLACDAIAADSVVLVAPADHPLAGRGSVPLDKLTEYPFVLREQGSGTRAAVERALEAAGLSPDGLQVAMELGSTKSVGRAVAAGVGLSFLSCFAVAGADDLVVVDVEGLEITRSLCLAVERSRPQRRVVEALRGFLLSEEITAYLEGWTCAAIPAPL